MTDPNIRLAQAVVSEALHTLCFGRFDNPVRKREWEEAFRWLVSDDMRPLSFRWYADILTVFTPDPIRPEAVRERAYTIYHRRRRGATRKSIIGEFAPAYISRAAR